MRESTRQDEINIFLDSENRSLRQQLLRSEDEVARLRRQLEYFVGHHGSLPVIIPTPTVDLSRLDTGLVAYIVSFIGTSIELRNLAFDLQILRMEADSFWAGFVVGRGGCATGSVFREE